IAETGPWQEIWSDVHALHAAGDDDLGVSGPDLGRAEPDGLETRAADLVDRGCARRDRQAAVEGCLAGGCLARAGLDHPAHEHLVDGRLGRKAAPLERRPDRDPAE